VWVATAGVTWPRWPRMCLRLSGATTTSSSGGEICSCTYAQMAPGQSPGVPLLPQLVSSVTGLLTDHVLGFVTKFISSLAWLPATYVRILDSCQGPSPSMFGFVCNTHSLHRNSACCCAQVREGCRVIHCLLGAKIVQAPAAVYGKHEALACKHKHTTPSAAGSGRVR
jgi:hypothetical protein